MKTIMVLLLCVIMFSASGCQEKSASQQFKDDMKKAGKQLDKDAKGLFK